MGEGQPLSLPSVLGFTTFDEIPKLIKHANIFHPNPANRKIYDELFLEFVNVYRNNKSIYKRLNKSSKS